MPKRRKVRSAIRMRTTSLSTLLHEDAAPDGYLVASDIQFKVERDEDGRITVYTRATVADRWREVDGASVTMVDETAPQPAPTPTPTPATTSVTATATPQPVPHIPQTGDSFPLIAVLTAALAALLGLVVVTASRRSRQQDDGPDPQLEPLDEAGKRT